MARKPAPAGHPASGADDAVEVVRRLALSLPGAVERDHHGFPSFRVSDKIFATLPTPGLLRVFVGEPSVQAVVAEYPEVCSEVRWGQKLAGVGFDLARAPRHLVAEYLTEAWSARASAAQRAAWDERH
ncbi:MAG: hypothetical protein QOE23_412 [Pseudonocardiales bacterium]|jgi:hypothetical protein|nr:hypothetical protein [Pseudonocardiales bacterium]